MKPDPTKLSTRRAAHIIAANGVTTTCAPYVLALRPGVGFGCATKEEADKAVGVFKAAGYLAERYPVPHWSWGVDVWIALEHRAAWDKWHKQRNQPQKR